MSRPELLTASVKMTSSGRPINMLAILFNALERCVRSMEYNWTEFQCSLSFVINSSGVSILRDWAPEGDPPIRAT